MSKLNIAQLRKSLKMNQECFRKEIGGISQSYLSELETGKKELTEGIISKSEYMEWKLNWPSTAGEDPRVKWRHS